MTNFSAGGGELPASRVDLGEVVVPIRHIGRVHPHNSKINGDGEGKV